MKIEDIKIGARHRKNNGDLRALADSIREHGLLQPIGVTEDNELVFGYRRLLACRDLLWKPEIDARVVNVTSIVAGEFAENEMRKDFTVSERVAIMKTLEEELGNRQGQRTDRLAKDFKQVDRNQRSTLTQAALLAGFGNQTTAREAKKAIEGGVDELVEALDRGELAINPASFIARQSSTVQREILKASEAERRKEVKKLRDAAKRSPPPSWASRRPPAPQRKSIEWPAPKEVDPEFKGTPVEFTDKYGHVPILTGEQYATERFGAWAGNMGAVAKEAKRMPDWPNVDHNWLRSPRPRDLAKMAEALEYLRPKIAEAEALLERAREAEERRPTPGRQDALSLPSA